MGDALNILANISHNALNSEMVFRQFYYKNISQTQSWVDWKIINIQKKNKKLNFGL